MVKQHFFLNFIFRFSAVTEDLATMRYSRDYNESKYQNFLKFFNKFIAVIIELFIKNSNFRPELTTMITKIKNRIIRVYLTNLHF